MFKFKINSTYILICNAKGVVLDIVDPGAGVGSILSSWYDGMYYSNFNTNIFSSLVLDFLSHFEMLHLISYKAGKFFRTSKINLNEETIVLSKVIKMKAVLLKKLYYHIYDSRSTILPIFVLQNQIYDRKFLEATKFIDSHYNENDILNYPFILQYAEYASLSYKEAADDIILKNSFYNDILLKTEGVRIKYLNKIKNAKTEEELEEVALDFKADVNVRA